MVHFVAYARPRFRALRPRRRGRVGGRGVICVIRAMLCGIAFVIPRRALHSQTPTKLDLGGAVQVGGESERYLRALQLAGGAKATAWSIRPNYGTDESGTFLNSEHPWAARFGKGDSTSAVHAGAFHLRLLRPSARLIFNSSFPLSTADGPTWAGRGVTGELQYGMQMHFGPVHAQIAPLLFLSQNAPFGLAPNGETGTGKFRDARFPDNIDAPQRFGSGAYGRLDTGNSSLAIALPGIVIGVSSAAQSWGPAREYPLILSGSSGGFPHAFAGTKQPLNLFLFSLRARLIAGTISQSAYSPVDTGESKRWASAAIITIIPRGLRGLEFGLTRFVEAASTATIPTSAQIRRVFSGESGAAG